MAEPSSPGCLYTLPGPLHALADAIGIQSRQIEEGGFLFTSLCKSYTNKYIRAKLFVLFVVVGT